MLSAVESHLDNSNRRVILQMYLINSKILYLLIIRSFAEVYIVGEQISRYHKDYEPGG